jgi:4-hydroxybenzoate polyprenyltransferase
MMKAMLKNTRIPDGRAYIGIGLFGLLINHANFVKSIIVLISIVLYVAYAFAINNCFDVDTDILNPRKRGKNPIANEELSFKAGLISSALLAIFGITLSYFVGKEAFLIYTLMVILATLYSAPPRLKARPVVDVLSHGIFFGAFPFMYAAYIDSALSREEALIAVALLLYSFAMELRNHLEDYESDLKANLRTTPIIIGKDLSKKFVYIFSTLPILIMLYLLHPFSLVVGMVAFNTRGNPKVFDSLMTALVVLYILKVMVV